MASASLPNNVYVAGVPTSLDEKGLRSHFEKFGPIASIRVLMDPTTKSSRGVGFVNYVKHEDAVNAIRNMNGTKIDAPTTNRPQALQVKFAYAKTGITPPVVPDVYGASKGKTDSRFAPYGAAGASSEVETSNVYVCAFPKNWTKKDLMDTFAHFGKISSARVLQDGSGSSRGVGFVKYETIEEASKAIDSMNGKLLEGADQPLQVRFAKETKKEETPLAGAAVAYYNPVDGSVIVPTDGAAVIDPSQLGFAYAAAPWGGPEQSPQGFQPQPGPGFYPGPPGPVGPPGPPAGAPYGGFPPQGPPPFYGPPSFEPPQQEAFGQLPPPPPPAYGGFPPPYGPQPGFPRP